MRAYVLYRQISMALPLQSVNNLTLPLQSVNAWPPATATLHPPCESSAGRMVTGRRGRWRRGRWACAGSPRCPRRSWRSSR